MRTVRWLMSAGLVLMTTACRAQQTAAPAPPAAAQQDPSSTTRVIPVTPGAPGTILGGKVEVSSMKCVMPVKDAATESQIREYLKMTGEIEAYRERWIGALDQQRSKMPVYWPESFWQDVKAAMRSADLVPMYLTIYQHGVTTDKMQAAIDSYRSLGAASFATSPTGIELATTQNSIETDCSKLMLNNTLQIISGVYHKDKAQIDVAKTRYEAEHGVSVQ